jgi:putative tricarboxylic transport membrane protein
MLTLGIPGHPAIAMIFAALLVQGVTPGPFLLNNHPNLFWPVVASMYIGNVMLLVLNLPLVGLWVQILEVPYSILTPSIVLLCAIVVYTMKKNIDDVVMMVLFGVVGYILRKLQFELERSLRQALLISAALPGIAAAMTLGTLAVSLFRDVTSKRSAHA